MIGVGVVGLGRMGTDHLDRLHSHVPGAKIAGVFDPDPSKGAAAQEAYGCAVFDDFSSLVASDRIDAVLIASPGHLHAEQVLQCIAAGKPALCEKPLAATSVDALPIIDAEVGKGKRLVQVGFMRRFDRAFQGLKHAVTSGEIGLPLMMHCVHRNPSVRPDYVSLNALNDSLAHEIDVARWILGEEIVAARVMQSRSSPLVPDLQDPKLILLETQSGIVIDVEMFVSCQYGYDVRCEIVGSQGVANISTIASSVSVLRSGARSNSITSDWSERFGESYARELTTWVAAASRGDVSGPSAFDGYLAALTAEKCVEAFRTGTRIEIPTTAMPDLYRN